MLSTSMDLKNLNRHSLISIRNPNFKQLHSRSASFNQSHVHFSWRHRHCKPPIVSRLQIFQSASNNRHKRLITACISRRKEILGEDSEISGENSDNLASVSSIEEEEEEATAVVETEREEFAPDDSIWNQIVEIMKFSGPAIGLWICGPLMSLIDTVVIGQGSSLELAALGPATVLCDYLSYVFMFLSIATSNMVATSLAKLDKDEVQHQISILLFVGLTCGVAMLFFTRLLGAWALTAFTGPQNVHMIPAANSYVQIRGLAWPAVLVGWVAQSASLGMKDSWGPLKALAVASAVNGIGDIVLCTFLGYGIAGAAWATMVSQVIAGYMMIEALNNKGYNAYAISVPLPSELLEIFMLAAPVFVTMMSKVAFYALIVYFATSMGTHTVAAHQVMSQLYGMFAVFGEPLSQTAQSFMPELMYGVNRSLVKARALLKSLLIIGALSGLILGSTGAFVPLVFPKMFSPDLCLFFLLFIQMRRVLIPFFFALCITSCVHSLEGTLLAGRDLKFISLSMCGCFSLAALFLMLVSSRGYGLPGCWCALIVFQWSRFFMALRRLLSPDGILYSEDLTPHRMEKLRAA
ncbi:protein DETOXIFICATION 46, chloroplastic-like [Actinidia eriantha]|uniref:protein DETOXIFICATION 46, chloroplastic-like n=1 Tax=Actinidia eriantha TaxID=165200 RepID=UPI00258F99AD|nr:protein DETOXIFICATION 46, chloroplastic-like [Actinidia eriantha]